MPLMDNLKPTILVSACLLGEAVRYDGTHRRHDLLTKQFAIEFNLMPCCPEAGAGLGVPRPPVQLVAIDKKLHALGVEDSELDVTAALQQFSKDFLYSAGPIHGAILKARSPSCGVDSTPMFNNAGDQLGVTNGLFADTVKRMFNALPVIDESKINNRQACQVFKIAVEQYFKECCGL